jgi:MoaA/NifB/PqqE/SkfB family radical SAM enzyme
MRNQIYTKVTNNINRIFPSPAYLILFVSDKCPNRCSHCWFSEEWKDRNLNGDLLKLEEIEKLSKSLNKVRFLSITGGEAFLRDDIEEIVNAFIINSNIERFDIPTSGFSPELISRKVLNILEKHKNIPFRVDVSLDGTENTHNNIRKNRNAYSNAIKTISELSKIREKYDNFDVSIITTVSDDNYFEIIEIGKLVEQILPKGEWMVNIKRGDTPEINLSENTINAYKIAQEIIIQRQNMNNFSGDKGHNLGKWLTAKNSLRRDLIVDIINKERKGGGCFAGSMNIVILSNGDVRACELLPNSIGNLRDNNYNLPEMLLSENAKKIRKNIQETECICTHECNLSVNILFQPSCWYKLLKYRFEN